MGFSFWRSISFRSTEQPKLEVADLADESQFANVVFTIPRETSINGSLSTKGKMRLEGDVYGAITASEVIVENQATVEGEVNADQIVVRGRIKGSLRAKHVYLYASGEVDGDIVISSMVIEEGGSFLGTIHQEKYSVAKPVVKRVANLDEARGYPSNDGKTRLDSRFLKAADIRQGKTLWGTADELLK